MIWCNDDDYDQKMRMNNFSTPHFLLLISSFLPHSICSSFNDLNSSSSFHPLQSFSPSSSLHHGTIDELTDQDFIHYKLFLDERRKKRNANGTQEESIVVRIIPESNEKLLILQYLQSKFDGNSILDFWTSSRFVNKPVDLMIPSTFYEYRFKSWLQNNGLIHQHRIMIPNVDR